MILLDVALGFPKHIPDVSKEHLDKSENIVTHLAMRAL